MQSDEPVDEVPIVHQAQDQRNKYATEATVHAQAKQHVVQESPHTEEQAIHLHHEPVHAEPIMAEVEPVNAIQPEQHEEEKQRNEQVEENH